MAWYLVADEFDTEIEQFATIGYSFDETNRLDAAQPADMLVSLGYLTATSAPAAPPVVAEFPDDF